MTIAALIAILVGIETGGHPNPVKAMGDDGKALGVLQTHKIMVREVNRLIGEDRYRYEDRLNREKSIEMCAVFLCFQIRRYEKRHGRRPSDFQILCAWNSGSIYRPGTNDYQRKVKRILNAR